MLKRFIKDKQETGVAALNSNFELVHQQKYKYFSTFVSSPLLCDLTRSEPATWGGSRWLWRRQQRCWFCASGLPESRRTLPITATRRGTLSLSTPTRSALSITLGEIHFRPLKLRWSNLCSGRSIIFFFRFWRCCFLPSVSWRSKSPENDLCWFRLWFKKYVNLLSERCDSRSIIF